MKRTDMTCETIKLSSGSQVPSVGLGLWKIENEITADTVHSAIQCGYRHFDSACDYGNEIESGQGLKSAIDFIYCDAWNSTSARFPLFSPASTMLRYSGGKKPS